VLLSSPTRACEQPQSSQLPTESPSSELQTKSSAAWLVALAPGWEGQKMYTDALKAELFLTQVSRRLACSRPPGGGGGTLSLAGGIKMVSKCPQDRDSLTQVGSRLTCSELRRLAGFIGPWRRRPHHLKQSDLRDLHLLRSRQGDLLVRCVDIPTLNDPSWKLQSPVIGFCLESSDLQ